MTLCRLQLLLGALAIRRAHATGQEHPAWRPRDYSHTPALPAPAPAPAPAFTSNLPFKDWGELFTNSAAASTIADRLVHKGLLVRITGKSRRSDVEVDAPQAA